LSKDYTEQEAYVSLRKPIVPFQMQKFWWFSFSLGAMAKRYILQQVYEEANRKCPPIYTMVQLSTP